MIKIHYHIELNSPLRIGTGIGSSILDNTVVKDAQGKVYIPGSSIKGKLRSKVYKFGEALGYQLHGRGDEGTGCMANSEPCLICKIFGSPHWQGELFFGNAVLGEDIQSFIEYLNRINKKYRQKDQYTFGAQIRTNVAINRKFRIAQPNHLFTTECIDPQFKFVGNIEGNIQNLSADYSELALLLVCLEQITHLGSGRGRGMGRCKIIVDDVSINDTPHDLKQLYESLQAKEVKE